MKLVTKYFPGSIKRTCDACMGNMMELMDVFCRNLLKVIHDNARVDQQKYKVIVVNLDSSNLQSFDLKWELCSQLAMYWKSTMIVDDSWKLHKTQTETDMEVITALSFFKE